MIVISYRARFCSECRIAKNAARSFYRRTFPNGRVGTDSICKDCRRARARANHAAVMADPARAEHQRRRAAARRRARYADDLEHREREKARHRDWFARQRGAKREQLLQDARIRAAIARDRVSGRRDPGVPGAYTGPSGPATRLDAAPLRAWLQQAFAHLGTHDIAVQCRVCDRAIYELLVTREPTVSLTRADLILTGAGRPDVLNALYPVDEPKPT
jgi:hypothetical protein